MSKENQQTATNRLQK